MEIKELEASVLKAKTEMLNNEPGLQIKVLGYVDDFDARDPESRWMIRNYVYNVYGGDISVLPLHPQDVLPKNTKEKMGHFRENVSKYVALVYRRIPEYNG